MSMAADYGVLSEDEGIALRGLFIIDPDQTIRYSVVHDNNVGRSTKETLRVLKALQTGSLCGPSTPLCLSLQRLNIFQSLLCLLIMEPYGSTLSQTVPTAAK